MPELSDKDVLPGYPEGAHSSRQGDDQSLPARPVQSLPGVAAMADEASGYRFSDPSTDKTHLIPRVQDKGVLRASPEPELSFVPAAISTVDCGVCNFTAASPDPETVEMMFRTHFENDGCHAAEEYADPTWHQSIAMTLMEWAKPVLPAYIVTLCAALIFFLFHPEYIPWTK